MAVSSPARSGASPPMLLVIYHFVMKIVINGDICPCVHVNTMHMELKRWSMSIMIPKKVCIYIQNWNAKNYNNSM